jgi:tetratricopeptide (TPR) repeat protein
VIGLVQVGLQSRADRYAYIPLIGVFIAIVWAAARYAGNATSRRRWLIGVSVSILACLAISANLQLQHWQNSLTLFQHAIEVTDNNYVAHNNLGELLAGGGRLDEAASHFNKALEINPLFDQALHNSGMMLVQQHKPQEAIERFSKAVEINPNFLEAWNKLGAALAETGRLDEAAAALSRALEISPTHPSAHANLALVLERQGKLDEAVIHYSEALRYMANGAMMAQTHYRLGNLLAKRDDKEQAAAHYREALRLKPDYTQAQQALENVLGNTASPQGVTRQ